MNNSHITPICTVAYGEKYRQFSLNLINQVLNMNGIILVLTDDINFYDKINNENLFVFEYENSFFSFHDKRIIAERVLKEYDDTLFLDADVEIKELDNLNLLQNQNEGIQFFDSFGDIGNFFLNEPSTNENDKNVRNAKYGKRGLDFLRNNQLLYTKIHNGKENYIEHFLEGRWYIKKDYNENYKKFFKIWDNLAKFCEKEDFRLGYIDNIGAGEGSAMSIDAYNSYPNFKNNPSLLPYIRKYFISNFIEKTKGIKPWNIAG